MKLSIDCDTEDFGICPACHEHCEYVEYCDECGNEISECICKPKTYTMRYVELDHDELMQAWKYYEFNVWLREEGWEPYVEEERYINQSRGNKVSDVHNLYSDFVRGWPENIKDQL